MIILDTDHLSVLQHVRSTGAHALRQRLSNISDEDVVTTVITYEEQMRSWLSQIGRLSDVTKQAPFYERLVAFADFFTDWELVSFDQDAADTFQRLRRAKVRISSSDLKIASISLEGGDLAVAQSIRFRASTGIECCELA